MINKTQLIAAEQEHWEHTKKLVDNWARTNVPNEYNYNSRATYWGSAMRAGIISQDMYDYAQNHFGDLWDYTGD